MSERRYADIARDLERVSNAIDDYERALRRRMRTTGRPEPHEYARVARALQDAVHDIDRVERAVRDMTIPKNVRDELSNLLFRLYMFAYTAKENVESEMRRWAASLSNVYAKRESEGVRIRSILLDSYNELREELRKHGADCGFVLRTKKPGDEIDPASLANDVSNCIHVVADIVGRKAAAISEAVQKVGRCYIVKGADGRLVKLCELWSSYLEQNRARDMYLEGDYEATYGYVEDGEAQFRVGSAPGHATRVRIEDGGLHVRYYDVDADVNEAMKMLLEKAGCRCRIRRDGVECECGLTPETIDRVARAVSLATSMDIRIDRYSFREELERDLAFVGGQA